MEQTLIVGRNTYIDRKYIDGFISSIVGGEAHTFWETLPENNKEYYLLLSQAIIDSQRYVGQRAFSTGQKLEFPRISKDATQTSGFYWRWVQVPIETSDEEETDDDELLGEEPTDNQSEPDEEAETKMKWVRQPIKLWTIIPNYVQIAQAEILVSMLPITKNASSKALIDKLRMGMTSFSLDGFSEIYGNAKTAIDLATISPVAHSMLSRWLSGSFSVL